MQPTRVVGVRIAVSAATVAGLLFIQLITGGSGNDGTVYADTPSTAQQASDQIATVSMQVAEAVHDPTLSLDARVQRINALATQFNQLVAQWQQLQLQQSPPAPTAPPTPSAAGAPPTLPPSAAGAPVIPPPNAAGAPVTAPPAATSAGSVSAAMPASTTNGPSPSGNATADQLRSQIAAISRQMAQISQDPSLNADAKTAQLTSLGSQFNQLMAQLQQVGG